MNGLIESILKNREGAIMIKVVISDVDADELRLGAVTISQKKYEQTTLMED